MGMWDTIRDLTYIQNIILGTNLIADFVNKIQLICDFISYLLLVVSVNKKITKESIYSIFSEYIMGIDLIPVSGTLDKCIFCWHIAGRDSSL